MRKRILAAAVALAAVLAVAAPARAATPPLWQVYDDALAGARYVDLTHVITPHIPVWAGFGPSAFAPALDPATAQPYRYDQGLGFEATRYVAVDGPARHAARPARALGARVRRDRRAARDLRGPPAGGHLDRAPGAARLQLRAHRGRRERVGEAVRPHPGAAAS